MRRVLPAVLLAGAFACGRDLDEGPSAVPLPRGVTVLAATPGAVTSVALDASTVYFTAGKAVLAVDKASGKVRTIWDDTDGQPGDVHVDQDRVYWLVRNTKAKDRIFRAAGSDGGAVVAVAGNATREFLTMAEHRQTIYFAEAFGTNSSDKGAIVKVDVDANASSTLLPTDRQEYGGIGSLAATDASLVWTEAGTVRRYALPSGPVVDLFTKANAPRDVAVDETYAYWVDADATIARFALASASAAPPKTLVTGQRRIGKLGLDARNVYWTDTDSGTVASVAKVGGDPVVLATGQPAPYAIAVDASGVYFGTAAGIRVARP